MSEQEQEFLNLDQVIEAVSRPSIMITIEPVEDDNAYVKVTPWLPGEGCLCESSIRVKKELLANAKFKRTAEEHICCGKSLPVFEMQPSDETTIPLGDVLSQKHRSPSVEPRSVLRRRAPPRSAIGRLPIGALVPPPPIIGCGWHQAFSGACQSNCQCDMQGNGVYTCCQSDCCA